jgi:hypothetical protein
VARKTEAERFLSHVEKTKEGCWLWTAYRMRSGYGFFRTPLRHELAHRSSYRLFKGPLISGLDVMHSCDNPGCVNPSHLRLGTRTENMRDAKAKGRTSFGASHGRSKLVESDISAILGSPLKQRETAEHFGISQGHISAIRAGKRWSYLAEESHHR